MSTVEEIKAAIGQLSAPEQDRLIEWLYAQDLKSAPAVMEGIAAGEADFTAGRTVAQDEAEKRMAKCLTKTRPVDHVTTRAVGKTLSSEWSSEHDEHAYRNL